MDRLNLQENEDKCVKTIALKAVGNKSCQDSSDESDEETFSLLSKKFSKFLKKRNNKNHLSKRYDGLNKRGVNCFIKDFLKYLLQIESLTNNLDKRLRKAIKQSNK